MSERIYLSGVRISYPHLFQARAVEGGTPKFSASFLLPQGGEGIGKVVAAVNKVIAEAQLDLQKMKPIPWSDGGQEFPGCVVIRTNATTKPHVVDQNVNPVMDPGLIYAGCYVNASVSVYSYKRQTGNGIAFGLDGVQFLRDGDRLDGRPTAAQMFQPTEGAPAPTAPAPAAAPVPGAPGTPAGQGGGNTPGWM